MDSTVYYTGPQSLKLMFSHLLYNFGDFISIFIGWLLKLRIQTFQPIIVIFRRDYFVHNLMDVHQFIGYCSIPLDP